MSGSGALVNLGELSKPATVLIEKISDAVGAVYQPYHIKRVAAAEAEAEKIRAVAKIEINELEHRALARLVHEEGRKQENIERISAEALKSLRADAKPENVESDWISHFFDKCKLVSDQQMQGIWSRLLSGEANQPGSVSKRTVDVVATLSKEDANLFTKLCGFAWYFGDVTPLIFTADDSIYSKNGITFASLTHLDDIGLIRFESISGFARKGYAKKAVIHYYGDAMIVEFAKETDNQLSVGSVLLSRAGQELAPICGSSRLDDFPEYVAAKWAEDGNAVYSAWPNNRFKPTAMPSA